MRVLGALAVPAIALMLAACGASESAQVRAKVQQFATAVAHRDYGTICAQVLAPALVQRLTNAGVGCRQAMQIALGTVSNPTISVGKVTVHGDTASAITLSVAQGQQASLDTIELVKTDHGWRLSSLASPLAGSGGR